MPSPDEVYGGVISFSRPDEELFYNRIVALPREEILKLCVQSKLHSSSATWFEARKVRISASTRAHSIRTMRRGRELDVAQKFLVPNCYCLRFFHFIRSKNFIPQKWRMTSSAPLPESFKSVFI
jgi:hypothetical protein